jgi:hypothetical protein
MTYTIKPNIMLLNINIFQDADGDYCKTGSCGACDTVLRRNVARERGMPSSPKVCSRWFTVDAHPVRRTQASPLSISCSNRASQSPQGTWLHYHTEKNCDGGIAWCFFHNAQRSRLSSLDGRIREGAGLATALSASLSLRGMAVGY